MELNVVSPRSLAGLALCLLLMGPPLVAEAGTAASVSQFGVTWTFDKDYETGQFANGDWWVVGPVKITDIQPRSTNDMHGSMLNPGMNGSAQGFDSRIQRNDYDAALNVAASLPLAIVEPASLLSAISMEEKTERDDPQLETIAILTVLPEPPPAGSFRPPYQGTDKTILANKKDLNYGVLGRFPPVDTTPDLVRLEQALERPWIELKTNWTGRYLHPKLNQPSYGRDLAHVLGRGLLALQLDYPDQEKETLLINMVQIGIDIFGAARLDTAWNADGGHNQGRKMPLLLTAAVLGNQEMMDYADAKKHFIFQEDQQTFYVSQEDVDLSRTPARTGRSPEPYTADMIGTAEWGIRHSSKPGSDSSSWDATYRTVSGAPTISHVLAARLMKLEEKWNHPALFDYYDRYWDIERDRIGAGPNGIPEFTKNLWEAYRTDKE